ncbi:mitochondrial carrier domain-containing protein [Zychaea mexicana]|uniref:mitochondrial carrier domain-containing protein n=1 Tax=Zychaea mexicana TaxID=64656 RepID=UPI0022FEEE9C|nr:mitochondrial carrier domain-containing protein [Zychaea mexicana]KAI9488142.1 mitochondrial carrier domain-containing protein [Zychaea mexicana]
MASSVKSTATDVIPFEQFKLPPVGHAVSGVVGSTIANLFIYPLDISTTRLQLENKTKKRGIVEVITSIYKEGGFKALYAGLGADTLATVLSSFIYFYCYTALRNVQEKLNTNLGNKAQLNVAQELFLGAEAALISRFFTTPVSNVTTRLQTAGKECKGFKQTVRDIYEERGGLKGFWTGYRASILLVSNPSITYFVFEKAKAFYLRAYKKTSLGSVEVFLLSALAKTVATMVTYPFIFIRTNMVAETSDAKGKGKGTPVDKKEGMIALMKHVIQRDGPAGLYKGMRAQITKGFFNQGIMYMIKDRVASYLALAFYTSMILKRRALQQ